MIPASPTPDSYNLNSHQSGGRAPLPHSMKASQGKRRLLVPTGISGLHSRLTRRVRPRLEGKKDSALLSSHDGYLLEPTAWRKGSEASYGVWRDDSGLFSWPCRKKGPHLVMTGASRGFSPAAAPVSDFSRGTTGSSESLSCGARDVRSPCVW